MKQYVGFARDHSGSMASLRGPAMKDYNDSVSAVKTAATDNNIDTVVSVVSLGLRSAVQREVVNSEVRYLRPLTHYQTDGGTPLFDAVGELIEIFESEPDAKDKNVTFLVMAITDGEENQSSTWLKTLGPKIQKLQATDRWTFVFRVPRGYARRLEQLGIPAGNIQEWDQSERGLREATDATVYALNNYYSNVSRGVTASKSFYTDLTKVGSNTVRSTMRNISNEVQIFPVATRSEISSFITIKTQLPYKKGTAFYELMKPEKAIQDYKQIIVRNRKSGDVYDGRSSRDLLGLPPNGTVKVIPGDHGDWDIFVQSTSSNRILPEGTRVLYWENA